MAEMGFIEAVAAAWSLGRGALLLNPASFQQMYVAPFAAEAAAAVLTIAALSEACGQSVVLFLHRVPPRRFMFSLLLTGLLFAGGVLLWAIVLWAVLRAFFGFHQAPANVLLAVSFGHVPFVFGFLILIPWLGLILRAILQIWTLLAVTVALHVLLLPLWQIVVATVLGWLAVEVAYRLAGGPVRWLSAALQTLVYSRPDPITIRSLREALIHRIQERRR